MTDNTQKSSKFFNHPLFVKVQKAIYSKVGIAIIFTLVGINIAILGFAVGIGNARENTSPQEQFFESDFAISHDPLISSNLFEEIRQMQNQMDKIFENHRKRMDQIFLNDEKTQKKNLSKVSTKEDEKSYVYELSFSGFDKENITTSIIDNTLTFSAKQEKKDNSKDKELYSNNSFHYSFSIPKHEGEPEIIREKDKVTVKLYKKK
jgi:HSP20 family molecular chaperone IbpA